MTHIAPAQRPVSARFRRYLLLLFLVPASGYLLMFPLVKFPQLGFDRWGGSKWAPVLDYSYHARGSNADLVIFGDSSAFLGIDPRLIEKETGIHAVVLPNTAGSLQVTQDMALRRYLAMNPPPRAIVFVFTPWGLDFHHSERQEFVFEGEEMLIRNGRPSEILTFALHHPVTFLKFPLQLNALLNLHDVRLAMKTKRNEEVVSARGHMDYSDPIGPITPQCHLPDAYLRAPEARSVAELMHRYTTAQTRVYLYLSPIPACGNAKVVRTRMPPDVQAAPPRILPPGWFAADGMYIHILAPHVSAGTELFIAALRRWGLGGVPAQFPDMSSQGAHT